jgi:tungstate transport system substrate-binding protein
MATRLCALLLAALTLGCRGDLRPTVSLGIPTTIQDSGLLDELLPAFQLAHPELRLRYVAAGSGELLAIGAGGDIDLLLAHSPVAEREFMEAGYGLERVPVMQNDFIIVGPSSDPAAVRGAANAAAALTQVAESAAKFLSRGDDSGTHRKEIELWETTGSSPGGTGYRELGGGMGAVLRAASELGAYTLCDRATFTNLAESLDLEVLLEGDPHLRNVYSLIIVAEPRELEGSRTFANWLVSEEGRQIIAGYGTTRFGAPLFFMVN